MVTSAGNPPSLGEAQTLTVPAAEVSGSGEAACPNEALRSGPSAQLPDCRAYEQVTPAEKGATQEIYNYGGFAGNEGTAVGEDGDHVEFGSAFVKWGESSVSGQSPYFFTRGEHGWEMTAGSQQPEAGVDDYAPQLFSPDLGQFAFESSWRTSGEADSPDVEFRVGPPGGPYTDVATVPRTSSGKAGWAAASEDSSKLILAVEDRTLLGTSTHTKQGDDLYEYAAGRLRQLNVSGAHATTIGGCGATMAQGLEGSSGGEDGFTPGSRHAISADGSRVYFEAVPGANCSEAKHLYVRINGTETIDLGEYKFLAATGDGATVLLQKANGEDPGLYLYHAAGGTPEFLPESALFANPLAPGNSIVSPDLSTVYFLPGSVLYRYDIIRKSLLRVANVGPGLISGYLPATATIQLSKPGWAVPVFSGR